MNYNEDDSIKIVDAYENNLKHINTTIPKRKLVVFAGISGSGKSSLAFDTIAVESNRQWQSNYPLFLRNKMPHYERPKVERIDNLTPSIVIDQKSIGTSARSSVGTAVDVAPLIGVGKTSDELVDLAMNESVPSGAPPSPPIEELHSEPPPPPATIILDIRDATSYHEEL